MIPCSGYLPHPLVFSRFKANLVRSWIFSVNSHTSERIINSTWHRRDFYQKAHTRPNMGQIQAFVQTLYASWRGSPPYPLSEKSWGHAGSRSVELRMWKYGILRFGVVSTPEIAQPPLGALAFKVHTLHWTKRFAQKIPLLKLIRRTYHLAWLGLYFL